LFVVEAGPSTCERSVIFRKRKYQLLPSPATESMDTNNRYRVSGYGYIPLLDD
jgi:hypothetical protein